jgi:hypothetical protein
MSSTKRDGEGGEDEIMQQYPSPTADGQDTGPFYSRDGAEQSVQPSTSEQQATRPSNLVELQLAAQLGADLAGEHDHDHNHNHDQEMPATDPSMSVEDPNLRNILPHAEQHGEHGEHTASHQYLPEQGAADSIPSHIALAMEQHIAQNYGVTDSTPPRKRSKVSRACDECRRKKVKCDAPSDTGETPCTSCRRGAIQCLFSRVPQKRGPSKG